VKRSTQTPKLPPKGHSEPFQRERVIASSFADTHGIAPSVRDELAQALADYRVELKAVWDKTRAWNERRGL
jgi:hypothetical protein